MPLLQSGALDKIRRDHDYMIELIHRIQASCTERGKIDNCNVCQSNTRQVCHGNIEQLIRAFVEVTLKHNLVETIYMEQSVPQAHRIAHNKAHMIIAEDLKRIRVVLSEDGNCILAIEGIDHVLSTLQSHFKEFDEQLESYLLATT